MFHAKVRQVGNSLSVSLPAEVARHMGLGAGDELALSVDGPRLVYSLEDEDERKRLFEEAFEAVFDEHAEILAGLAEV
jgi:putative addiction module antidote